MLSTFRTGTANILITKLRFVARSPGLGQRYLVIDANNYCIPIELHQSENEHLVTETIRGSKLIDPRYVDYEVIKDGLISRSERLAVLVADIGHKALRDLEKVLMSVKEAVCNAKDKINKEIASEKKSTSIIPADFKQKLESINKKLPAWQLKISDSLQKVQDYVKNKIQPKDKKG